MEPLAHQRIKELQRLALLRAVAGQPRLVPTLGGDRPKLSRAILYPIAIGLSVLTAAALVLFAATISRAEGSADPRETSDEAAVGRFYAALNSALATGEMESLDDAVWPEIVIHRADGGVWRLGDLRGHLLALHAKNPSLAIRLDDLVLDSDRGLVEVSLTGFGSAAPLAVSGGTDRSRVAPDSVHVADGRVVAYAGLAVALTAPELLFRGDLPLPAVLSLSCPALTAASVLTAPLQFDLIRLNLAPNGVLDLPATGSSFGYQVESGEVVMAWRPLTPAASRLSERRLGPGDHAVVDAGTPHRLRSLTAGESSILVIEVRVGGSPSPIWDSERKRPERDWGETRGPQPPAIQATHLAGSTLDLDRFDPRSGLPLAVERFTLPPGRHTIAGVGRGLLLAVAAGHAVVPTAAGLDAAPPTVDEPLLLSAGETMPFPPTTAVTFDNLGADPLVLLLVSLSPPSSDGLAPPIALGLSPVTDNCQSPLDGGHPRTS